MCTSGVLEGLSLNDYRGKYQSVLQTLGDGLEVRLKDSDPCHKGNRCLYFEDRIVVPEVHAVGPSQFSAHRL